MVPTALELLYYLLITASGVLLAAAWRNSQPLAQALIWGMLLLTGTVMVWLILTARRLPLYGPFEASVYLIFLTALLECLNGSPFAKAGNATRDLPPCFTGQAKCGTPPLLIALFWLALLFLNLFQEKSFNPDFFMYANPWVNLFFNLRLTATAFFCRGALLYLGGAWPQSILNGQNAHNKNTPSDSDKKAPGGHTDCTSSQALPPYNAPAFQSARTMILTGLVLFLCSEWAGSWWCLNWFGDSWRWSRNFFKAAMVFMVVMLSCHLPPWVARHPRIKAVTGTLPALFLLWIIFHH